MTIRATLMQITPQVAAKWIDQSRDEAGEVTNWRKLNRNHMQHLARDMKAGLWSLNGETIKISSSGRVLDGNHRLHAVLDSGATIESLVVFGVQSDESIDTGRKRGVGEYLGGRLGVRNHNHVAAAINAINQLRADAPGDFLRGIKRRSLAQIIEQVERTEPWMLEWLTRNHSTAPNSPFPHAQILAIGYESRERLSGEWETFCNRVASGAGLGSSDPALVFRNRVLIGSAKRDLEKGDKVLFLIKAWNAHVMGKEMTILKKRRLQDTIPSPIV